MSIASSYYERSELIAARDPQTTCPAICPRCGSWFPSGTRRCPVHRIVLVRPDERVRRFGPENLSSTIQTVVEPPSTERPRPPRRQRGRWPTKKPMPVRFFEATTQPGDDSAPLPDPVGSLATVIPTSPFDLDEILEIDDLDDLVEFVDSDEHELTPPRRGPGKRKLNRPAG